MRPSLLALLLAAGAARAAAVTGRVEALSAAGMSGWACIPGDPAPLDIALTTGTATLTVLPADLDRQDIAAECGGTPAHGFSLGFGHALQSALVGVGSVAVFALSQDGSLALLPPGPGAANPAALPRGRLVSAENGAASAVLGRTGAGAPYVRLFAGGPADEGGVLVSGAYAAPREGGGYAVSLAAPDPLAWGLPEGASLPLYATATDPTGAPLPLARPLLLPPGGTSAPRLRLEASVAQSGALSGIHTTLFTRWLPAGQAVSGLAGTLKEAGNADAFHEALAALGYLPVDRAKCRAADGTALASVPALGRIWSGILKDESHAPVALRADWALPYPISPPRPDGACLALVLSAGYPFLDANAPRYTTTTAEFALTLGPPAGLVFGYGLGGEYRLHAAATPRAGFTGIEASRPLTLDGVAAAFSAGPVLGAPRGSHWLPAPSGNWRAETDLYLVPAATCLAQHYRTRRSNGQFATLEGDAAGGFVVPAGSTGLLTIPLASHGAIAEQNAFFEPFTTFQPGHATGLTLATGDCLLAVHTVSTAGPPGVLDVEDQSTLYLRPQ